MPRKISEVQTKLSENGLVSEYALEIKATQGLELDPVNVSWFSVHPDQGQSPKDLLTDIRKALQLAIPSAERQRENYRLVVSLEPKDQQFITVSKLQGAITRTRKAEEAEEAEEEE